MLRRITLEGWANENQYVSVDIEPASKPEPESVTTSCTSRSFRDGVSRWERGENPAAASYLVAMAKMTEDRAEFWRFLAYVGLSKGDVKEFMA